MWTSWGSTGGELGEDAKAQPRNRRLPILFSLATALVLSTMLLASCGSSSDQTAAQRSKARLDHELAYAHNDLGIPDSLLNPIETQEQKVSAGAGGFNYNYQDAASNYNLLYTQLIGVEQTAPQVLQQQTGQDIQALSEILSERRGQGFSQINAYQARFDEATKDFASAKTAGEFASIDATVQAQTVALNALWPAYQKLQVFESVLQAVHNAGINSQLAEIEYQGDIQVFAGAAPSARYQVLDAVIDGQINQLMADQTESLPYVGGALLDEFQARINLLRQYGQNSAANTFEQEYSADAQTLASAKTLADYLTFSQVVDSQTNAMTLPLVRGQAFYDLNQLRTLINIVQTRNPLEAYEYANPQVGIGNPGDYGSPLGDTYAAVTVAQYQNADDETYIMLSNLRALVDNLNDPTPPWEPHATDLSLMQEYGIISGKVVIISLREQTARFYENGQLVFWSYVTTGRPEAPSPPGVHYAIDHEYHILFKSGDPQGSALWYAPTPVNWGIRYAAGGYFLHDAWWRYKFGPGSNLPHWDPLAFDGGSHGCVNFPEDVMEWVYDWVPDGAPIVLY
ncbi:MAG: L,D-transpeptidase [Ktedonobacterales bacterium]